MGYRFYIFAAAITMALSCPSPAVSQTAKPARAVEFLVGGALVNMTRTTVTDFRQTEGGDYVFTLKEKLVHGGCTAGLAVELAGWLYADLQGTVGMARYFDSGKEKQGWSVMAGPGLQLRPFVSSQWLQPYLRAGIGYYRKSFTNSWFGTFDGDVAKEALWKAEDAWNKGFTFDAGSFVPVSLGIGLIGWMGNRTGIQVQGEYLHSLTGSGANFLQASAGIVLRLGGPDKRKGVADRYVKLHPEDYDGLYSGRFPARVVEKEVVREVPVTVEVPRKEGDEAESVSIIAALMDNVHFDFDQATITEDSAPALDEIARILASCPSDRFLVAGYTDAKGPVSYNENLSERRAEAVCDALVRRGISRERLACRGFGKRVAIVPAAASDDHRRADRKVVLERVVDDALWEYLKK